MSGSNDPVTSTGALVSPIQKLGSERDIRVTQSICVQEGPDPPALVSGSNDPLAGTTGTHPPVQGQT